MNEYNDKSVLNIKDHIVIKDDNDKIIVNKASKRNPNERTIKK